MNSLRIRTLVSAFALFLCFSALRPATVGAEDRVLTGELVVLKGSSDHFRLVGHDGTFVAPYSTSLADIDGKNVRVVLAGDGRVAEIAVVPINIDRVVHSNEMISGQMIVGDPVQRTFSFAGDPRVYVAPANMDIRPYNGRKVEVRFDEQGQVASIEPLAAAVGVPLSTMICSYETRDYSDGAAVCQAGTQYRCENGSWRSLGTACVGAACELDGSTYGEGSTRCVSKVTFTCDSGQWRNVGTACKPDTKSARAQRTCLLGGATLAPSSYICRDGKTLRCNDGTWVPVGKACS